MKRVVEEPGVIMKVGRGTEIEFYKRVSAKDQSTIPEPILSFFPKFFGLQESFPRGSSPVASPVPHINFRVDYVKMEDLTCGMSKACVMDLKMGTQTWTDDAFYLKRLQLESRDSSTTTAKLGFRITGLRVYRSDKTSFEVREKDACASVTDATVEKFLQDFFSDGLKFRHDVLRHYIKKLRELLAWFRVQNKLSFYSSSLLFTYDGSHPGASLFL